MSIKNILVVDDDAKNLKLIKSMLSPQEYKCLCKKNAQEALAAIDIFLPDIMLIDVMMPVMDGFELTKIIKTNNATKNIPIILVTALSDRDSRLQGLEAGAEEFINKPFVREELMIRIRNLLRLKEYNDLLANQK